MGIMKKSMVWLRAIACILITNHHLENLYPSGLQALAFGGYFGDCLYFVISGYCLAGCVYDGFGRFAQKRLLRVYLPVLLYMPFLVAAKGIPSPRWEIIMPLTTYHFVPSILTLYPLFYFCTWLNERKVEFRVLFAVVFLTQLAYYFLIYDFSYPATAQYRLLPMLSYFQMMLLGAAIKSGTLRLPFWLSAVLAAAAFLLYGYISFRPLDGYTRIIQLYLGTTFGVSLCSALLNCESQIRTNRAVEILASMTLEVYLVQYLIIEAFEQFAFPTGLLLCIISIAASAYCLCCASKWIGRMIPSVKQKSLT